MHKYYQFLTLKEDNEELPLVPTFQIDIIWHTHILSSTSQYIEDCKKIRGKILEHDDSLSDNFRGTSLAGVPFKKHVAYGKRRTDYIVKTGTCRVEEINKSADSEGTNIFSFNQKDSFGEGTSGMSCDTSFHEKCRLSKEIPEKDPIEDSVTDSVNICTPSYEKVGLTSRARERKREKRRRYRQRHRRKLAEKKKQRKKRKQAKKKETKDNIPEPAQKKELAEKNGKEKKKTRDNVPEPERERLWQKPRIVDATFVFPDRVVYGNIPRKAGYVFGSVPPHLPGYYSLETREAYMILKRRMGKRERRLHRMSCARFRLRKKLYELRKNEMERDLV